MGSTMSAHAKLDELPTLTPKQTAFVNGLIEGKTATDAYRQAYNCRGMSNGAIWVEASRLRANTKVALWLRHFQRIGMDNARVTIEAHLAELARARELALELGQAAAAVQAEHYRGKAVGLYEDRFRVSASISDGELVQALDNLLGAEIANAIGTQLGVEEEGPEESMGGRLVLRPLYSKSRHLTDVR
jgi:hypothetical protein